MGAMCTGGENDHDGEIVGEDGDGNVLGNEKMPESETETETENETDEGDTDGDTDADATDADATAEGETDMDEEDPDDELAQLLALQEAAEAEAKIEEEKNMKLLEEQERKRKAELAKAQEDEEDEDVDQGNLADDDEEEETSHDFLSKMRSTPQIQSLLFRNTGSFTHGKRTLLEGELVMITKGVLGKKKTTLFFALFLDRVACWKSFRDFQQETEFKTTCVESLPLSHISLVKAFEKAKEKSSTGAYATSFSVTTAEGARPWRVVTDSIKTRDNWILSIQTVIDVRMHLLIAAIKKKKNQRDRRLQARIDKMKKLEEDAKKHEKEKIEKQMARDKADDSDDYVIQPLE